jgi:hypothetical protein
MAPIAVAGGTLFYSRPSRKRAVSSFLIHEKSKFTLEMFKKMQYKQIIILRS